MVSYFKTQSFELVMALGNIVLMIIHLIQGNHLMVVAYSVTVVYFVLMSFTNYNVEKIRLLEAKVRKYDALVEKVNALYEANRVNREYMKLLEQKINQLKYDPEDDDV